MNDASGSPKIHLRPTFYPQRGVCGAPVPPRWRNANSTVWLAVPAHGGPWTLVADCPACLVKWDEMLKAGTGIMIGLVAYTEPAKTARWPDSVRALLRAAKGDET